MRDELIGQVSEKRIEAGSLKQFRLVAMGILVSGILFTLSTCPPWHSQQPTRDLRK